MFKHVYEINEEGYFVRDVLIREDEEVPENYIETLLPQGMFSPKWEGGQWVHGITEEEIDKLYGRDLESLRISKMQELSLACNQSILGRFSAVVDGVTYYFSNDMEAQSNFKDAKLSFADGTVDEYLGGAVPWTCYDTDGKVCRLNLNAEQFQSVYVTRLLHQNGAISKLRDDLQKKVDIAADPSEIEKITWDSMAVNIEAEFVEEEPIMVSLEVDLVEEEIGV